MTPFIRALEYWVPSNDRSMLEFGGGHYGAATRFAAISPSLLRPRRRPPGQAGKPASDRAEGVRGLVLRRIAAARAEGLTCGIAVPIFAGDFLNAVMVIFCGDDAAHAGAIELWHNDPHESHDMTLVDGYYGNTGDTFEFISRSVSFRRGTGLPGMAWQQEAPIFLEDLGRGPGCRRADSAVEVGISRGFAMPGSTPGDEHYVMAFLSALATPIAQRSRSEADGAASGWCARSASANRKAARTACRAIARGEGRSARIRTGCGDREP